MSLQSLLDALNPWWSDPRARRDPVHSRRRDLFDTLRSALLDPKSGRALVLAGPRQVGKSTLLGQIADSLLDEGWPPGMVTYFDFSDERCPRGTSAREIVEGRPAGLQGIFLLDEITRAPDWDLALKSLVDQSRRKTIESRPRILATDSAASLLRRGARESLQGRIDEHRISGLSLSEFVRFHARVGESDPEVVRRAPNVADRYLSLGGFPEHVLAEPSESVRRSLRVDVVDRAIARDLASLGVDVERVRALFLSLVQDSGGIFEAASRARDLDAGLQDGGTDARTVLSWLRILEGASLLYVLAPRLGSRRSTRTGGSRRLRGRPKVYAEEHALIAAFAPFPDPMSRPEVRGKVLEAAVLRHLRLVADGVSGAELSFFRSRETLEIDFVLDLEDRSIGIEATTSLDPHSRIQRLGEARDAAELDELVLVHGGFDEGERDGIRLVPYPRFLLDPWKYLEVER